MRISKFSSAKITAGQAQPYNAKRKETKGRPDSRLESQEDKG